MIYLRPGHVVEVNGARAQFPIVLEGVKITKVDGKLVRAVLCVQYLNVLKGYTL